MFKSLSVGLLDHTETPEFFFRMIEVAVTVSVRANEARSRNTIYNVGPRNTLDRKVELRDPWASGEFVLDVELRGRCVLNADFFAQVVFVAEQHVRLLAVHQIDIPRRWGRVMRQVARKNDAGDAVAEKIDDRDGGPVVHLRKWIDRERAASEGVDISIHPAREFVFSQVDDVSSTRSIDVG